MARVDVGAIERNCARLLAGLGAGTALCAVVKADGYGHGAVESARAALRGGAAWLAVATAEEAAKLRASLPDPPILTMGALTPEELDIALAARSDIALWRGDFLELAAERAQGLATPARVHVKHDSGMGRLGERDPATVAELCSAAAGNAGIELVGLWTHLATADEADPSFMAEQLDRFEAVAHRVGAQHEGLLIHACNSAATLREEAPDLGMVRCGVAIYGLDPFGEDPAAHDLEPALELHSYVADVKRFPAGASAGYGRRWRAPRETRVGILPIGYGDGVRRALTNNGDVLIGGRRHPLVGTVSMDNVTVDLGPDTDVAPGAEAVLIGAQGGERILCEELAQRLDTINYEVTCSISARVPREHRRTGGG